MKQIISLIACFSIAAFAQYEQYQYPPQQDHQQQMQYQYPTQQDPQQMQYQYQQQNTTGMDRQEKIQRLIRSGVRKNKEEIQKESFYLSPADREALYNENRKKAGAGWAALDFFPGFGIGSYIQGDIGFGITQSIMDGVGLVLLISAMSMNTYYEDCSYSYGCYEEEDEAAEIVQSSLLIVSAAVLVTSRIMAWILPFKHQRKYNKALKSALNSNNVSYSIDPLIVPKEGTPAIGLAFNLHY